MLSEAKHLVPQSNFRLKWITGEGDPMATYNQKAVEKAIAKVGDLPAIPEVVAEVLRLTENPDVAMADVSKVIERDPALSAKLLKVSNSPYYGMKQVVGTIKLALVILGVREVRNIVIGISVVETLRNRDTDRLVNHWDFWNHSVLVGGLAKRLSAEFRLHLQGEDFIAGLLHDIGKMILWRQIGRPYEKLFADAGGHGESLVAAERAAFEFDHADAAATLAVKWNMPQSLADALWCHHPSKERRLENAKDPQLAALVRISNAAARADWSESLPAGCIDDEPWRILLEDRPALNNDQRCTLLKDHLQELEQSPVLVI